MSMNRDKALEILGLNNQLENTEDEIKKAYRKKALAHHPDKHSGAEKNLQSKNEELLEKLTKPSNSYFMMEKIRLKKGSHHPAGLMLWKMK